MNASGLIVMAGGGSGGHLSPGLAVREAVEARVGDAVRIVFACSEREIDREMLTAAGATFRPVPARPPSLRPDRLVRFARGFRAARRAAVDMLRAETGRSAVLALGGFVSVPIVTAARSLGVPRVLLNLDAVAGRANRFVAARSTLVLSAVPVVRLGRTTAEVVGMPIRRAARAPGDAATCRAALGLDPGTDTLFITGASQGSSSINAFVTALARADPSLFRGWQVIHLAGASACAGAEAAWAAAGIRAHVAPFMHEIGRAWGAASLAVSRAGANSVAEAAANRVPTLFLPYPWHRDRHQAFNVQPLVAAGAAAVAEDRVDPALMLGEAGAVLGALMGDPEARRAMVDRLARSAPADAATHVADILLGLLRAGGSR